MTIREFYEWAVRNGIENYAIAVPNINDPGVMINFTQDEIIIHHNGEDVWLP